MKESGRWVTVAQSWLLVSHRTQRSVLLDPPVTTATTDNTVVHTTVPQLLPWNVLQMNPIMSTLLSILCQPIDVAHAKLIPLTRPPGAVSAAAGRCWWSWNETHLYNSTSVSAAGFADRMKNAGWAAATFVFRLPRKKLTLGFKRFYYLTCWSIKHDVAAVESQVFILPALIFFLQRRHKTLHVGLESPHTHLLDGSLTWFVVS